MRCLRQGESNENDKNNSYIRACRIAWSIMCFQQYSGNHLFK